MTDFKSKSHRFNTLNTHYDVIVLGAGVIGINTAYWLSRYGLSVLVVDERSGVGMGASHANGGQISVCHAEPWASPSAIVQVIKWLAEPDAPLLFQPKLDVQQWRWLMGWLRECTHSRHAKNIQSIVSLALRSRECLQQVREAHQLNYEHKQLGIMHFYQSKQAFEHAKLASQIMQDAGCAREVISESQVLEIEPALHPIKNQIIGGTYTAQDESGNAYLYCKELMRVCKDQGVEFVFETQATPCATKHRHEFSKIQLKSEWAIKDVSADHTVVCLGAHSANWLRGVGVNLNIYPAKGYSLTIPIENEQYAPCVSLTDDEYKLVFSRLGNQLRVAGTAELSGYSEHINQIRCEAILNRVKSFFPQMGGYEQTQYWAGLRPCTPNNVPIMQESKIPNLWINTGHGTLGWTMSCGAGQLMAQKIANKQGVQIK